MPRRITKVTIGEEAFIMMIAGAAEVYDKETYGLLIGRRRRNDYLVQYAVPHQTTRRYTYGVQITPKHEKKLLQTINFFKGYKYMGEFHSHPNDACILSKQDRKDMIESPLGVSIVIRIDRHDSYLKWKYDEKDKCLYGSIDDSYYIEVKAYRRDDTGKRIRKLRLNCPFIKKLNNRVKRVYPGFFEKPK
ncbi:TPA: hypothetical protein HA265_03745 [Candidatus Woesearchaeota archaeon]|nr:hypothetical protein [Candidatus Woesearchaeota archaeon]